MILSFSCGKSDSEGNRAEATSAKAGGKPGAKSQGDQQEIDVDKLDIPDRMKEAIRSGQIPPDKVKAMLARMQGGDAPLVEIENVARKNLNSYQVLNGIVEPERMIEIYSRLSAYIKQIIREEGDFVKENEVLVLLDDTEIKISHQQAQIQLDQAKLSKEEEEKNFARSVELRKKELISEQEYQASEGLVQQRQLDYEDRLESFKNLQLQLNWTKIRALSSGYITSRLVEVGDKVNQNEHVYTIEDFSPLLIRVFVPSSDSINLRTGMESEVTTDILPDTPFIGKVKLINPRIDVQTGTVKVTIEVHDKTLSLKPGMFVEVKIVTGVKENILVIPRKAVLFKQNKTFVFVVNQGQVAQREVTLGLAEEDDVEILSGLEEGETIVKVGVESLKDGERIAVAR